MVTQLALVFDSQVHLIHVSLECYFAFASEITLVTNKFSVIVGFPEMSVQRSLKAELGPTLLTDKPFLFMHCFHVIIEEFLMLANKITQFTFYLNVTVDRSFMPGK